MNPRYILPLLIGSLCLSTQALALIDSNSNGVCDIWEQRYKASDLVDTPENRTTDTDGDSQSNYAESLAGTDPRDKASVHKINIFLQSGTSVLLSSSSQAGKTYQVYSSTNLSQWTPEGIATLADGQEIYSILDNQDGDAMFYHIVATETDTDGDEIGRASCRERV